MKKIILMAFAAFAAVTGVVNAGTPITQDQLPKEARSFIAKYFPGEKIRKVEQDQGRRGMEYEVDFTSGAEVEFREDGTWKDVKAARGNSIPSAIVPSAITKHVQANYSGQSIVEISRKRGGYEIELSNGSELKLTEDAKPLVNQGGGRRGGSPRK